VEDTGMNSVSPSTTPKRTAMPRESTEPPTYPINANRSFIR